MCQLLTGFQGKESKMRFIKNSYTTIVESTEKQVESYPDIRNVRKRHLDFAAWSKPFRELLENFLWIVEVLQDISENDRVELTKPIKVC